MSTPPNIGRASRRGPHVLIVGGGPVGLTLAHELLGTNWRITIVESGGRELTPAVQQLNVLETSGYAAAPNFLSRARAVGGTAAIWNTFVDGRQAWARLVPMDERDFATAWPLTFDEVERYYERAYRACGLDDRALDHLRRVASRKPRLGSLLEARGELMVPTARFTTELPRILDGAANVDVVVDRTVVALRDRDGIDGSTVTAVDTVTRDGRSESIECDVVVLAAGGIENPRILLQAGLANGAVGRYFTDHFTLPIGQFRATPEVQRALLRDLDLSECDGSFVTTKVQLRAATRAQHGLLNAGMTLLPVLAPVRQRSVAATTRQAARMAVGAGMLAAIQRNPRPRLGAGHWSRVPGAERLFAGFTVSAQIEQSPQPENRVILGATVDRHGARRARVVSRLVESDVESFRHTQQLVVASLVEAGAEPVASTDEIDPFALWYGVAHHMCSTRMHVDPVLGVADATGRVHGTTNLYCAGSSVFSTGGYANPTLTALALTTRLADHLGDGST